MSVAFIYLTSNDIPQFRQNLPFVNKSRNVTLDQLFGYVSKHGQPVELSINIDETFSVVSASSCLTGAPGSLEDNRTYGVKPALDKLVGMAWLVHFCSNNQ
jgi:hypothetical protein